MRRALALRLEVRLEVARALLRAAARGGRLAALRLRARTAARVRAAVARPAAAGAPPPADAPRLDDVRRRLELLLAGLHGRDIRVEPLAPPRRGGWLRRAAGAAASPGVAMVDGDCVRLPAAVDVPGGPAAAHAHYRLLAIEQGERVARGTAAHAAAAADPLECDLFLLCEAAAVDRRIARTMTGLRPALAAARAAALATRPLVGGGRPLEREVDRLVREQLAEDPAAAAGAMPDGGPDESLAWARAAAARLRDAHPAGARDYRGLPPVGVWGSVRVRAPATAGEASLLDRLSTGGGAPGTHTRAGQGETTLDTPSGAVGVGEAPRGAPSRASAGGRVEAPHLDPVDAASAVVDAGAGASAGPVAEDAPLGGVAYPEWDAAAGRLVPHAATVVAAPAAEGDGAWAAGVLREHAALVRRVRERFERLRSRRMRAVANRDGDELDLDACVRAAAERLAGGDDTDRLYVAVRPARRALAIALLVDVSGSTDAEVDARRTVIDVEKEAVLLAGEALDALGDRYAVLTFSSRGRRAVRVTTIKDFDERSGEATRRRLAAVAPGGNTRLGAALRHATALLERQPAGHRLLLVLSDGKPSDTDGYHDRYAVEDSRQAALEARARGVYPYCLTVDREEPEYLSHIFGAAGHTILRQPDQLPVALVGAVRALLGR